jgi:hypothetical protein
MNPLLKRGDTLLVAPCNPQEIHPGDVVLFPNSQGRQVVHRVVAITTEGVTTRGDNNPDVDNEAVAPHKIIGRVTAIQRQGRTLPISAEAPATLYLLKARRWVDQVIFPMLQPVYHRLAHSRLFQGRLAAWMKPRLIHFPHSEGTEWQLWLGNLLIGRKLPRQAHWSIRRPFLLFVDEDTLPH